MFLCYHGTDLERFAQKPEIRGQRPEQGSAAASRSAFTTQSSSAISHLAEGENQSSPNKPLKAVYLGSMGQGYDLMTILQVASKWKHENKFPAQIHFAGTGDQLEQLKAYAAQEGLLSENNVGASLGTPATPSSDQSTLNLKTNNLKLNNSARVVFHGYLNKDAINELLFSSDIALVPNRPDSLVACPYKAGEYAAAGLPIISCLQGELGQLLKEYSAGTEYKEGDADSLHAAFEKYLCDPSLRSKQKANALKLTEKLFNRKSTYQKLSEFITS